MNKVLITQLDSSYFLNETLSLLERHILSLRDAEITLFCRKDTIEKLSSYGVMKNSTIVTEMHEIADKYFDQWFNLTVFNFDENLHHVVQSESKKGSFLSKDDWSVYLETIREKSLYLNLHLQDIYAGVLGLPKTLVPFRSKQPKRIVFGHFRPTFMSFQELTEITSDLKKSYPHLEFSSIDEIDYLESHAHTLYIGPATIEAIKLSEAGARCIFAASSFTGMNLMPYGDGHLYLTTHREPLQANRLEPIIHYAIAQQISLPLSGYSVYQTELTTGGLYFKSLNQSDYIYATYQSFFVLWTYLLGLIETEVGFAHLNQLYASQFKNIFECCAKISELHYHATREARFIYEEFSKTNSNLSKIQTSLEKINEVQKTLHQFSTTHLWFNPIYRFFQTKIKSIDFSHPVEASEDRYLLYVEFYQTLEALKELFTVTLAKNEVSIK